MDESFRIFVSIATAIVLEAMPFLALGSLLSAIVEVCVSAQRMARAVPTSLAGRLALGVGAGVVLPTCECGVVPVARRLLAKGMPPSTTFAYLLAAPIVNPVVLASTYVAFRGDFGMVGARAGVAVLVAGLVGWRMRDATAATVLRSSAPASNADHEHDHTHTGPRLPAILRHAGHDFLEMGKFLILGALAAAALKTATPPETFSLLEGSRAVAIGGMMLLAIALSVCSEADAFVAASFVTLPAAAHLAFITIGPMVDLKLLGLYAVTFRRAVVGWIVLLPLVLVFLLCLALGGLL